MEINLTNQYDKEGFKHGLWKYVDLNGHVWCEAEYKNGKLHGQYKDNYTFSNCQCSEEGFLEEDVRVGHWKKISYKKIQETIHIY